MSIYARNQAKRQRTASVAKCIPTVLLTSILEMKHEMEVVEWREEHKQQFAPVLDVIERMWPWQSHLRFHRRMVRMTRAARPS
jgi:hypothetical protein